MKASTILMGVALAALTPGCTASTEPTEEDRASLDEETAPDPKPATRLSDTTPVPTPRVPTPGPSQRCGFEDCGTNHNRRILRLAPERT